METTYRVASNLSSSERLLLGKLNSSMTYPWFECRGFNFVSYVIVYTGIVFKKIDQVTQTIVWSIIVQYLIINLKSNFGSRRRQPHYSAIFLTCMFLPHLVKGQLVYYIHNPNCTCQLLSCDPLWLEHLLRNGRLLETVR